MARVKPVWWRQEALFAFLLAIHLAPVWSFAVFPSQDGPAHLENANVIRRYHEPAGALFREYYVLNGRLEPNWVGHLALAGLLRVVPPATAEKLLVSLCVVALPLAARYALVAIQPAAAGLAVLVFPFTLSWFVHMGFYYFSLSLALFFVVIGYWLRHRDRLGPGPVAVLAALGLALQLTHLISLIAAAAVLGLLALLALARERDAAAARRLILTAAAFLPGLLLTGWFVLERGWQPFPPSPMADQWRRLRGLDALVSFGDAERLPSAAVFWTFAVLAAALLARKAARRSFTPHDALVPVAAVLIAVYLTAPQAAASGGYVNVRLAVYPFCVMLLWFAAEGVPRPLRIAAQTAAAALAVTLVLVRLPHYREVERGYREFLDAGALLPPGTILLPLRQADVEVRGEAHSNEVDVFLHAAGRIAADRNLVQLVNYEARTGHFPTRFRPDRDPYTHLGDPERNPPCVDLETYRRRTGRTIDYVLLWEFPEPARDACTRVVADQLRRDYQPVYTSPSRRARLFRLRG